MKNYFEISEIPNLKIDKDKLVEQANVDFRNFARDLPLTQKTKRLAILVNVFVKMYLMAIKFTESKNLPKRDPQELFNFTVDTEEENQENGHGLKAEQIAKIIELCSDYQPIKTSCFDGTLDLIPSAVHSAWYVFYKHGAVVRPWTHNHSTIITHILLEDIVDGEFTIVVNGEEKRISKKGEYFSFSANSIYEMTFTGQKAMFLTFSVERETQAN